MKHKILIVEDDESVRAFLRQLFGVLGHDFIVTENGEEGLTSFRSNREEIDRIVTNNDMPKMNGIDFIKAVRKVDPNIHICFMSGRLDGELEKEAVAAGATVVLAKPANIKSLMLALRIGKVTDPQ